MWSEVNVWGFLAHNKQIKSTHSSDRFHWTNDLHQRRLICEPHRNWGWSTTLASGSTHKGGLPIVLRKENGRNKITVNVCGNVPGRTGCNTGRPQPGGRGARSRRGLGGAIGKKGISGSKKAGSRSNKRLVTESERKTHRNQELKNTSPPRQKKMADCFKKPKWAYLIIRILYIFTCHNFQLNTINCIPTWE